jgi:hypothetical protein
MNKDLFFWMIILFQFFIALGTDEQRLEQARDLFMQGDWSGALQLYRLVEHKNSAVFQNIGNCYFNEGQYGQALVFWKRASVDAGYQQLTTIFDEEQKAYQKLGIVAPLPWVIFFMKIILMIPLILIEIIFLFLLCNILLLLRRYWQWQKLEKREKNLFFLIFFGCMTCVTIWYARTIILKKDQAIVVKQNVLVYAGPERTFHVVEKIQEGQLVHIIQSQYGMYQISSGSLSGWVTQDTLESIYNYE